MRARHLLVALDYTFLYHSAGFTLTEQSVSILLYTLIALEKTWKNHRLAGTNLKARDHSHPIDFIGNNLSVYFLFNLTKVTRWRWIGSDPLTLSTKLSTGFVDNYEIQTRSTG